MQSPELPSLDALVRELRVVVRYGPWQQAKLTSLGNILGLRCIAHTAASEEPLDLVVAFQSVLEQAIGQLGESASADALRALVGLGTMRGQLKKNRVRKAADALRVSPEAFRKSYELRLLTELAGEIYRIDAERRMRESYERVRKSEVVDEPSGEAPVLVPRVVHEAASPDRDIRPARAEDFDFVTGLMIEALEPFYGGDHAAHAKRIFDTHVSGGVDAVGHFSSEQRMFIVEVAGEPAGLLHLVGKRQGTLKISPLIVSPEHRNRAGLGLALLSFAESFARQEFGARQLYCTVAAQNYSAQQFFTSNGFIAAGRSPSHYKQGIDEVMLYKPLLAADEVERFDRPNISVVPFDSPYEVQVRELLLDVLPGVFGGVDADWMTALFEGYGRRDTLDVNAKYKLLYIALDRRDNVLGVAGATPKKGEPIKLMPFVTRSLPAFVALLTDVPFALKPYGRLLYMHLVPTTEETIALQKAGWALEAALPGAYRPDIVTQQWSLDISAENFMRSMRVKQRFLDQIEASRKTLEVRVAYANIRTIQPGELIRLESASAKKVIRVNEVRNYQNFDQMLEVEDPGRIVPDMSRSEVLDLLKVIYPPEKERLGVVVLDIAPA